MNFPQVASPPKPPEGHNGHTKVDVALLDKEHRELLHWAQANTVFLSQALKLVRGAVPSVSRASILGNEPILSTPAYPIDGVNTVFQFQYNIGIGINNRPQALMLWRRSPQLYSFEDPPPPGRWHLRLDPQLIVMPDGQPVNPGDDFEFAYVAIQ